LGGKGATAAYKDLRSSFLVSRRPHFGVIEAGVTDQGVAGKGTTDCGASLATPGCQIGVMTSKGVATIIEGGGGGAMNKGTLRQVPRPPPPSPMPRHALRHEFEHKPTCCEAS